MNQQSAGLCADQAEATWETMHICAASFPDAIRTLRLRIMEFFSASLFSQEDLSDMEIAVGEACSNAIRHGSPRGGLDEVNAKCMRNEHTLIVEILDNGHGFDPNSVAVPQLERCAEDGMGIFLMRSLIDEVEFTFGPGTTVRLVKHRRN